MAGGTVRRAVVSYLAEIAQLADGTYYVALTATSVDDEEPQLINQEIDTRRGVSLQEAKPDHFWPRGSAPELGADSAATAGSQIVRFRGIAFAC
jgi:hypothetical protein